MIAGLEEITSGELYIGDKLMNDVAPKDRDIAMVFQSYALYPHMTVYDNMAFSLSCARPPRRDRPPRHARPPRQILEHHGVPGPQAQGSVRRPAPACGHRPRHRALPGRCS
jgi:multiple sugar transport system ATP-binding protein